MPSDGASFFSRASSRGGTGTPEGTGDAGFCVRRTGEDEQQVGEAVEVDRGERVRVRNGQDRPLGPPTDGAREEEPPGALAPAGQDEALQLRQRLVRSVDLALEPVDGLLGDPEALVSGDERNGEVGPEVEEFVLDPVEAARPADERVQLV